MQNGYYVDDTGFRTTNILYYVFIHPLVHAGNTVYHQDFEFARFLRRDPGFRAHRIYTRS